MGLLGRPLDVQIYVLMLEGVLTMLGDRYTDLHESLMHLATYSVQISGDRASIIQSCSTVRELISQVDFIVS